MRQLLLIVLCYICICPFCLAQFAYIRGVVTDTTNMPIPFVSIYQASTPSKSIETNEKGKYKIKVLANQPITLIFYSSIGYKEKQITATYKENSFNKLDIYLEKEIHSIKKVPVIGEKEKHQKAGIEIKTDNGRLPSVSGNFEDYLSAQALGVSKTNELSSTYSVRGGNFDENLVYVNDFEIYRPYLIRSGQQEGLSFINSSLVKNAYFSSGGFEAKYGDKLSSVLDITYKTPSHTTGSISASLLGIQGHIEGTDKSKQFTYVSGIRYKSNQYILRSLETDGQYSPSFLDLQTFFTYTISPKIHIESIFNYAFNQYQFTPTDRKTNFGQIDRVLQLRVFFDGQERDVYHSFMSGGALHYRINEHNKLKFMIAGYRIREQEAFDITGEYFIDEVNQEVNSNLSRQTAFHLGTGLFQNWGRNFFNATIIHAQIKGTHPTSKHHTTQWGISYKYEYLTDRISEWERRDSSGFSLPLDPLNVHLFRHFKGKIQLHSHRFSGFMQNVFQFGQKHPITLNTGIRFSYGHINKEILVSPRIQFSLKPSFKKNRDLSFRWSLGIYQQAPFYKELRNQNAVVNLNLKAQKSLHAIFGIDYNFTAWNRPFKFTTELYGKYLWDVIPYTIDNLLIRYFAHNNASAYVVGADLRLHGQLVKNEESWISLSFLRALEKINATDTRYVPRPTDQVFRLAVYFQDNIPKVEFLKVHLNFIFATGLPFGPPNNLNQRSIVRIPSYKRLDLGFSAAAYDINRRKKPPKKVGRIFKSLWLSLEVFNIIGIRNTVSYLWLDALDTNGSTVQYSIPNALSDRRINFKMILKM